MKDSDYIQQIKERDALIDVLIVSHLKTLGRIYPLESANGLRDARSQIIDNFAIDYIVDEKFTNELGEVLESELTQNAKINFLAEGGKRKRELGKMLREMSRSIRSRTLRKNKHTDYDTQY